MPCLHLALVWIPRAAGVCQTVGITFFHGRQESGPVPFSRCPPHPSQCQSHQHSKGNERPPPLQPNRCAENI